MNARRLFTLSAAAQTFSYTLDSLAEMIDAGMPCYRLDRIAQPLVTRESLLEWVAGATRPPAETSGPIPPPVPAPSRAREAAHASG